LLWELPSVADLLWKKRRIECAVKMQKIMSFYVLRRSVFLRPQSSVSHTKVVEHSSKRQKIWKCGIPTNDELDKRFSL
jgi:hypothetical protein